MSDNKPISDNSRKTLAEFVGQDGLTAVKMAKASKEAGWKLTSAKPHQDGTWEVQLTGPDGKTVTPHRLNNKEAAAYIGTWGPLTSEKK